VRVTRCKRGQLGLHGVADVDGRCPYCGRKIDAIVRFQPEVKKVNPDDRDA